MLGYSKQKSNYCFLQKDYFMDSGKKVIFSLTKVLLFTIDILFYIFCGNE